MSDSGIGDPTPKPYPYEDAPDFPTEIGVQPEGMPLHACMGLNSCQGADRFGIAGHPVDGMPNQQNDCAGQGYCSTTASHSCHVQNNCANQGGCGLYGTGEEMNQPGQNACRSLGSCATPINAERFSTNGPNKGKSVWLRARAVFEDNWPTLQKELAQKQTDGKVNSGQPLPSTPGSVPSLFEGKGPAYLWVSDDNEQRGHMAACGSSGLSGAGGCS